MLQHDVQCHGMQQHMISCCRTKNDSTKCCGTSFLAVAQRNMTMAQQTWPQYEEQYCSMTQHGVEYSSGSFLAKAQRNDSKNAVQCCGTLFLAATQRMMQHNAMVLHSLVMAQRTTLWHITQCCSR